MKPLRVPMIRGVDLGDAPSEFDNWGPSVDAIKLHHTRDLRALQAAELASLQGFDLTAMTNRPVQLPSKYMMFFESPPCIAFALPLPEVKE